MLTYHDKADICAYLYLTVYYIQIASQTCLFRLLLKLKQLLLITTMTICCQNHLTPSYKAFIINRVAICDESAKIWYSQMAPAI